jgi:phage-related minor tail protein
VYLQEQLALAINNSNYDRTAAIFTMLKSLQGETDKTADQFKELGDKITDSIAQNASNAVNSFIDNIGKAQMSFGDFAASVVKDIAKMIVQLLIMKPLMDSIKGFMGFGTVGANAQGNAYSSGTSLAQGVYTQPTLFKFAKGGTFGRSTGLMGEAGPEAIVPLKRTASGDLGVQASPVNVNVYNNAGVDVETRTSDNADGSRQIDILIERKVRDGIANGSFDRAMRGSYGLARVGA